MKKKQLIAVICFCSLVLSVFLVWYFTRPDPVSGQKTITLEVVHGDGSSSDFTIETGEESMYGLMVYTVDGETADWDRDQSWWCLTKSGEWLDTGLDGTLIADGDHYEFTYTIG